MGKFTSAIKTILLTVLFLSTTIAFAGAPSWNRVDYTNTTAFLGTVKINDYSTTFPITVEEGDYIGAFVGEECRMIAEVFEYKGKLYVSSVIHGGEDFDSFPYDPSSDATTEEVEWKVWDNSANSEVAEIVLGTLFTKPSDEILSYEIGKPNTNSELESLAVTDITIVPDFDPDVLDYTVELPSGSTLPVLADYVAEALDSRATVTVEEATDFEKNNVATITVTAEDGTTTEYTITFSEAACAALPPVVKTPVEYCVDVVAEALTATASGTLVWYDDESLTTALASAPTPETTTAGTTKYYVTNDDECESEASEIEVIVYENPTPVIEGTPSFTACVNEDIDLSISGGEFASQTWSGDASTYLLSTTDATTILTATTDGIYTLDLQVEDEKGCVGTATATITINAIPTVTLTAVSDMCSDEAAFDIVATPSEDGVGKWSENVTTVDNLTATFDPSTNVGDQIITYDFTSDNGCALETTATLEFTVTEKTLPESESPVLVQIDGDAPELTATGDGTINWYDADKNLLETAAAYQTTIATDEEKSFTFYVTNTNGTCESDFVEVIVTITGCLADLPVVTTPVEYCIGATAEALTATATGTLTWYDDASLTTALTEAPTPETTVATTTTYYVTNTDGGCETTASEIEVVVKELSETPTVANVEICEGETADLTADGTDLKWYDDAYVLLTEVPTGLTAAATYYVTQNTNGCESDYAKIDVIVNNLPVVEITPSATEVCEDGSVITFTVSPIGGTISGNGITADEFDPTAVAAGEQTISYEYTEATTNCVNTAETTINVVAITEPVPAIVETLLVGDKAPVLTATADGTIKWYDKDGNFLAEGESYDTDGIDMSKPATYTYKVTNTNDPSCESDFVLVVFEVVDCETPAPIVAESSLTYCQNETAEVLSATGTDLKWYDEAMTELSEAPTPETSVAAKTTYYVTQTDECEGAAASIVVEVIEIPVAPTAEDIAVCEGTVISNPTAEGESLKWYDDAMADLTLPYTPTESHTINVTQTVSGCESEATQVEVTVNELPVVTLTADKTEICIDETVELTLVPATGGTLSGFGASGNEFDAEVAGEGSGILEYEYTDPVTKCSNSADLVLTVNDVPAAPEVTASVEYCVGDTPVQLSAVGTGLLWSTTEGGVGSATAPTPSTASEGTTNYYVSQTVGGCESETSSIEVTVNALPTVEISTTTPEVCVGDPVSFTLVPATGGTLSGTGIDSDVFDSELAGSGVHPIIYEFVDVNGCENSAIANISVEAITSPTTQASVTLSVGEDAPTLTATGDGTIKWYDDAKTLIKTGDSYTTTIDTDSEATYTYYVTNTNGTCESDFVEVTVIVSGCAVEAPEVTASVDYCVGDVAAQLSAEGTDLNWYTSVTGGVGSATAPTPSTVSEGKTIYYVSQTDACESPRASITVNVYDKPNKPTVEDIIACEGDVIPALSAIGTDISWYDELGNHISPIVPVASGVFYATQTINGCESDKATLTVEINPSPVVPTVTEASQTLCEGEIATFVAIIDKDATPKWENEDGTVVSTTSEYTTSTPGTYYVSQSDGTCSSIEKDVVLYVKPIPEAPVVSDVETCFGSSQDITYSGTANWYASQTDVTPLETGLSYTPTVTTPGDHIYYVSQIVDGCEGAKSPVTYTINDIPTFTPVNEVVSEGSVIPELTVITDISNVVNWYENVTDDTPIYTGASFDTEKTKVGIYTYYVDVQHGDCKSMKQEITLQITDCEISAPVVSSSKDEVCEEDANPTLTATGTNSITWFSDAELTNEVSSSASFEPADVEPGLYTYYAVQTGSCQSASASVSFTINQLPTTEIVASSSIEEDADRELITVTPVGGDLSGDGISGNYFDPSLVSPGVHTITYSYTDANGCVGTDSHKITVTAASLPDRDALGDAIADAKDVYDQYLDDDTFTDSEKEILKGAINVAEHYYDNYEDYTQEQLDKQEEALKQAIKDFIDSKLPAVDVSDLEDLIAEAEGLLDENSSNQGTAPGQYPESAFEDLQNAIIVAQSYVTNPPKTQIEVTAQENVLKDAIEQFKESLVETPDVTGASVQNNYVKMIVGETFEPVVTFYPIGAIGNLIWESSDSDIVTVNMAGIVTAVSRGITQVRGTLIDNNRITVSYSVEVTEVPKLVSTSIAPGLGNAIILEFSEEMASPGPGVYTELVISGTDVPLYTIHTVSVDPTNKKRLIVNLGDYIDDPEDIHITYSGSSIKSAAGAEIESFHSQLGVSIGDAPMSLSVYPTICTDKVFVTGAETADIIKVVSATSAVVATVTDINSNMEIDMTGLTKGVYTIVVVKGKQTVQARVVKQ